MSFAIVRRGATFIDLLNIIMRFANAFENVYGVNFSDVRFDCIVDDTIKSNFLSSDSLSTDYRYIHVTRLDVRHDTLSSLLKDFQRGRGNN